jgi:hypothetical protein
LTAARPFVREPKQQLSRQSFDKALDGTPDHRDSVLSPEDRAADAYLMTCVSRSRTPSLTLDL